MQPNGRHAHLCRKFANTMAEGGGEGINLFALSLEQLNQLKQSIEEELQGLNGAIHQLQVSRNKLTTSKEALGRLSSTPEGTSMLVPITSSLYVPGETTPLDTVLIDVGTGYFIEKSMDEAQAFLGRKMALIESQAVNVQNAAQFKQKNLQQTGKPRHPKPAARFVTRVDFRLLSRPAPHPTHMTTPVRALSLHGSGRDESEGDGDAGWRGGRWRQQRWSHCHLIAKGMGRRESTSCWQLRRCASCRSAKVWHRNVSRATMYEGRRAASCDGPYSAPHIGLVGFDPCRENRCYHVDSRCLQLAKPPVSQARGGPYGHRCDPAARTVWPPCRLVNVAVNVHNQVLESSRHRTGPTGCAGVHGVRCLTACDAPIKP